MAWLRHAIVSSGGIQRLAVLSLALAWCGTARAADSCGDPGLDRPRVGLVLSGGGSKAGAHIGVLKALEELRVPVDCIAGTSAGAIIGGLYAAGLSPQDIETVVAGIDWLELLDDRPSRVALPFRRKRDSFSYLVDFRPGFKDGRIAIPAGLIQGQEVVQFLRRQLGAANSVEDFAQLPTPIRVVATDLQTGKAVSLERGDLARAVRASLSIPVLFAPVEWEGRLLIDGGPANNLPVDVARAMGADVVIAVDITSPLLTRRQLDSAVAIADQMTNLLTHQNKRAQIERLNGEDVLITPALEGLGGLDFEATLDSVAPGVTAVKASADRLSELSVDASDYALYTAARQRPGDGEPARIARVDIAGDAGVSDALIESRLGVSVGDVVATSAIEAGVAQVYGLDLFQSVDYRLVPDSEDTVLRLDIEPKTWGPDYLQFGLLLSEDFSVGSEFSVGMAYLSTAINELGGEWRVQLDLGERQGLGAAWYQPISAQRRHFFEVETQLVRRSFRFFDEGELAANLRVEGWGTRLSLGTELGNNFELRVGWNHFDGDGLATVGSVDIPDQSVDVGEYFTQFQFDTLDDVNFPRRGAAGGIAASWSRDVAGAKSNFEQLIGETTVARSFGEFTVLFGLEAGTTMDNDAPLESQFLLGGLGRLSGYSRNRFAGQHFALGSLTGYQRLSQSRWLPRYAGLSLEAGNVWDDRSDVDASSLLFAGALFFGADTVLGPVYLAWGLAEGGEDTVFLTLGNPFVLDRSRPLD